jgi:hypothetical protein
METSLVKFVENDEAHVLERRVVSQQASQHALGDDFDACAGANPGIEAHTVTDRFADTLAT